MNKLIGSIAVAFLLSACTDYLSEYKDEYDEEFAEGTISSSEPDETSSDGKTVSSSSAEETSSESAKSSSSSGKAASSSSSGKAASSSSVKTSSSSGKSESSSSSKVASSSSEVPPFGTCSATQSVAELGASVTWGFEWAEPKPAANVMLSATFAWSFEGGSPAVGEKRTATTSYATSGVKTASVTVNAGGTTQTVTCSVNVNGSPITGCKCIGTNLTPDVSQGEQASWTISGCTSAANITSYTWTGATADGSGLSATAPVSAKGDKVTGVSFTVANDDNTKVTVACEDAKAVDSSSPDYVFEISGDQLPSQELVVPSGACMNIIGTWNNSGYTPTVSVLCSAAGNGSPITFKMTYGDKTYQAPSSSWAMTNAGGAIGKLEAGPVQFNNICVEFTGIETVTCGIQ
ncbi:hypothetical protein [Fibrobacter sp.]